MPTLPNICRPITGNSNVQTAAELGYKHTERQASAAVAATASESHQCKSMVMLQNWSQTHSQILPLILDAPTDAWCVHSLSEFLSPPHSFQIH